MKVTDIFACIEEIAPLKGAADWDNCGVQVAGVEESVSRVAVTLDPSPDRVAAALEWGAEMVITHHPLYMQPKRLDKPGYFLDTTRIVMCTGAWLYSAHTSLDAQPNGPAGWLFRALKLDGLKVMSPADPADPEVGIGFFGTLPKALSWKDFAFRLGKQVDRDFWTLVGQPPEKIETVAYCTGSGGSLMDTAATLGADVFITGDLKYHQALEANQFTIDVGHFSLEEVMTDIFADQLGDVLGKQGVKVRFIPGRDPLEIYKPTRI